MQRDRDLSTLDDDALHRLATTAPDEARRRRAAAALLRRHRHRVLGWCRHFGHDGEEALDLAQEVLLRVYRGLASYRGPDTFTGWLFAVCRRTCLNALRRRPDPPGDVDPDLLPAPAADPERRLLEAEDRQSLLAIIADRLDPLEQQVLWLRCEERLPLPAIERMVDCPGRSGARAVLQRARRKLRAALARRDRNGGDEP